MELRLGNRILTLDEPRVMGIVNVTPDSFSDGGDYLSLEHAVARAAEMYEQGADIIDIGGESTRPGAVEMPLKEELDRVLPVIEAIAAQLDIAISVDTSKPQVMQHAVDAGAVMINDVFALRQEGAMEVARDLDAAICLMHMRGTPRNMQAAPEYDQLPQDVISFLAGRVEACSRAGIGRERLVVDPGFGFGKNDEHNLQILANLDQFAELGLPLLVGLSRKKTLGNLTGRPARERGPAGIAAALAAVSRGAHIVRTHDVAGTVDALKIANAVSKAGQVK
jgi:dihydropteroate synthase